MDPQSTVHYFTGAKDFTIRSGRFRTIAGNSYTNCYPPPASPVQARPRVVSATSFFSGASDFEIGGGEFSVIDGDAVDLVPAFDGLGPVFLGVREDDKLGVDDPAPQIRGDRQPHGLDVPRDVPSHGQLEDTGQHIDDCTGISSWLQIESAENHENEMAPTDVPMDENANPPPIKATKIERIWPLNWIRSIRIRLWPSVHPTSSRGGLCAWYFIWVMISVEFGRVEIVPNCEDTKAVP
ncbi:hypothetical protein BJ912DRAFT_924207 [Pholiota molesta]|nr:hypothetical protein BJ912DRAFT_924207 [Pholiota molesta]